MHSMKQPVKSGDLAVMKWPPFTPEKFERIRVGESRRSITLWDNPEFLYPAGRFPNRSIWGNQVVLVLAVVDVATDRNTSNRMAHVFAPEGLGWVHADNLEAAC
jgi:hypothetical protein